MNYLGKKIKYILSRLGQEEKPFWFLISRLLWKTRICRFFSIKKDGYIIKFSPTSLASTLWVYNNFGSEDEQLFRRYVKSKDTVIDVGANIGTLTLLSAILAKDGQVICVEAHPVTYSHLVNNIELNAFNNIRSYNVALGEEDGIVYFTSSHSDDQNKVSDTEKGLAVELKRLDTLLLEAHDINLLKIDTEGYELFVLRGTENLLARVKCIYFESYEQNLAVFGHRTSDLINFLKNRGFVLGKIIGENFSQIDNSYKSVKCENLLAVQDVAEFIQRTGYKLT